MYLFEQLGLVEHFALPQKKLLRFFHELECGYDDANPYHNRAHAASVMHLMHAMLEHGELARVVAVAGGGEDDSKGRRVPLVRMACLVAAAVHDYEHLGLSNDFLVQTFHERALRYNDQHVNEQHHAAAAFAVLLRPECNFLSALPARDFRRFRSLVVDLVVATDARDHNNILNSFIHLLDASVTEESHTSTHSAGSPSLAHNSLCFRPAASSEAVMLLQVAMKCADLGHLALDWKMHLAWVRNLEEEFFAQGDREKSHGLPVSFLMDRDKTGASKTQVGFFDFVVLPLFRALVRAAPPAGSLLRAVLANHQLWREIEESQNQDAKGSGDDELASDIGVERTTSEATK